MIADIGYGLNSIGYLVLLLLLFTVRKPGLAKYMLSLATLVTLLWSLSFVSLLSGPLSVFHLLQADTIKQGIWLLFIASCLKMTLPISGRCCVSRPPYLPCWCRPSLW